MEMRVKSVTRTIPIFSWNDDLLDACSIVILGLLVYPNLFALRCMEFLDPALHVTLGIIGICATISGKTDGTLMLGCRWFIMHHARVHLLSIFEIPTGTAAYGVNSQNGCDNVQEIAQTFSS